MKWIVGTLVLAARIAHADQCEVVSPEMAAHARQLIADHPMVVMFCEPCSDRVPGEPAALQSVSSAGTTVQFNGVQIDLAYTYVQTSPRRYDNLAALVNCPTAGVSPSLRVEDATDRGVLIVPDSSEAVSIAPVAPIAPLALPQTVIVETADSGLGWAEIAAGCAGTSLLWIGALRLRRRRAHRPRLG
jgi:hypothetical protein